MKKVDLIIQVLQEELIIRKKSYFALSQATKILREKGILNEFDISNGYLKEKLEKGEIPQAQKTTGKPSQWRIHKDKDYKRRNPTDDKIKVLKKQTEKEKTSLPINSDKPIELTKQQTIWLTGIVIFSIIIILMIGNNRSKVTYTKDKKLEIKRKEAKRNSEIIYTEIKKALKDSSYLTCENLFYKMQKDYPDSPLFEKVKGIYDSALFQLNKKTNVKKNDNKISKRPKNASKELKIKKIVNVEAQAYSDGIISCNVYLNDLSGRSYYLDAKSLSVKIYGVNGFMNPTGEITTKNTNLGLYIDIPMGSKVFLAKSISLVVTTREGTTYESGWVQIDH